MEPEAYQQMRLLQSEHWWFVARRRILDSLIDDIGLEPDAQILEAGCGPGGNVDLLSRHGRVTAFDMDPATVALCGREHDIVCALGRLPDDHPFHGTRRFDMVAALDVIEHVEDDAASVGSLASCLREGGWLLLTVPAFQWMFSAHDRFHHHRRRYRRHEVQALVESAGLQVQRAGYFNALLFPAIAMLRLMNRGGGNPVRSDMTMPWRWVNTLLKRVFASEVWWLRHVRFPFGTSIFLVARKVR